MSSYISDFLSRLRGSTADAAASASSDGPGKGEDEWATKGASAESVPWIRISSTSKGQPQVSLTESVLLRPCWLNNPSGCTTSFLVVGMCEIPGNSSSWSLHAQIVCNPNAARDVLYHVSETPLNLVSIFGAVRDHMQVFRM